jgi:hypothetical protein
MEIMKHVLRHIMFIQWIREYYAVQQVAIVWHSWNLSPALQRTQFLSREVVAENRWDGSTTTLRRWRSTWIEDHQVSLISVVLLFYRWLAACDVSVCCDSCYIRLLCGFLVIFISVFYCVIVNKFMWITLVCELTGNTTVVPCNVA